MRIGMGALALLALVVPAVAAADDETYEVRIYVDGMS